MSLICENCGKEFAPKRLDPRNKKRFCSRNCSGAFTGKLTMANNRKSEKDPANSVQLICQTCGKSISRFKSNYQDGKHFYCSRDCVDHWVRAGAAAKTKILSGGCAPAKTFSRGKRGERTIGTQTVYFRSAMEADYARYLTFLGIKWEYEPKTFWFEQIRRGVRSYTPDFFLPEENTFVELKGWMDPKSKTKLKRMRIYYPDVKLTLIEWAAFKALCKGLGKVIPNWEHQ